VEGGPGTSSHGGEEQKSTEGEKTGGFVESEPGTELAGGGTEYAAAEGGIEATEAVEFDGHGRLAGSGADGAASATDGLAGKEDMGEQAA
jgi:hypothetical protein